MSRFILFLSVILSFFTFTSFAGEPVRWAVITAPGFDHKEFGDLVLAKLSEKTDIELLERDEVQKVLKEIEITAVFGEKSIEKRQQLGVLLKADRLIVLSERDKIFILDTKYGLSLFSTRLEIDPEKPDQTCDAVVLFVESVNKRYQNGVKSILAVSYFVSKSFERSYDYLQSELPELLSSSLLHEEGLAVVAIEEVDAILREYALSGEGSAKERPVTLKLGGEITATMKSGEEKAESPQLFSLKLELRDGEKVLETIEKQGLELKELGPFVTTDVKKKVLSRLSSSESSVSLDASAQKVQFLKDAVSLDSIGAYDLSLKMRKAAFLLDPDDLDNTVNIILGPCKTVNQYHLSYSPLKDRYEALPYLEQSLKSKNLKLMHGLQLIATIIHSTRNYELYDSHGRLIPQRDFGPDPLNFYNDIAFFYRLFPLLMELPTTSLKEGPSHTRTDWVGIAGLGHDYGPAEQYRAVSDYIDNIFYDAEFSLSGHRMIRGTIDKVLKPYLNKESMKAVFEMRSALPKESVLWSPGFLFNLPAHSPKKGLGFPGGPQDQERLMQAIPRDIWEYHCNLWRSSKDEDCILLADMYELYWLGFNDGVNDNGDWKKIGIPKIRKIFEEHWKETEPGVFVPKDKKFAKILVYLRSLEIFKELALARLGHNLRPGTYIVYELNVSSISLSFDSFGKTAKDCNPIPLEYLRQTNCITKKDLGTYSHLKNDHLHFRTILDWEVSLNKYILDKNKGRLFHGLPGKIEGAILEPIADTGGVICRRKMALNSEIDLNYRDYNAGWRLEKLDESTDILWTDITIYRLSRDENGKIVFDHLESLRDRNIASKYSTYRNVQTDGKYIFSVTGPERESIPEENASVRIMDREGRVLCSFDQYDGMPEVPGSSYDENAKVLASMPHFEDGSPEDWVDFRYRSFEPGDNYDWFEDERVKGGVSIHPFAPGTGLFIGKKKGSLPQTWIGKFRYDESSGQKSFKLLFGTTRSITPEDLNDLDSKDRMDMNFSFPWSCRFSDSKHPERNQVIIGRRFGHITQPIFATPLLVDFDTEEVMLLTDRYPDLEGLKAAVSIQCVNDVFVLRRGYKTIEIYHRNEDARYIRKEITCEFAERHVNQRMDYYLFPLGNFVYAPGPGWYRIDTENPLEPICEHLINEESIMPFNELYHFAPSALFGIWALTKTDAPKLFDPSPIDRLTNPFEGLVPEDKLEKHDIAVKRLRELGVNIGHGNYVGRVFHQNGKMCEGSFAIFCNGSPASYKWQGTPDDLELLKDVYDLRSVGFIGVELRPEDVKMIAEIPSISEVAFCDTGISDVEFEILPLKNYSHILISEKFGSKQLTDHSLEKLRELSNIKYLSFNGMGFTDHALEIVNSLPDIQTVTCEYGSISEENRAKINRKKRQY